MQNLTEKVYECSLAVEAHMVCDMLASAGISARVDGEFLQSGAGELPLGNLVKVRVEPARAAEAREVIAEWEKQQPRESTASVVRPARFRSQLWFLIGALVGGTLVFLAVGPKYASNAIDYDGDGVNEVTYYYWGSNPSLTEMDRNGDREVDVRWDFDIQGYETGFDSDDDFDGRFEWSSSVKKGQPFRAVLDADGDGRPERVSQFRNGVISSQDFYFASGGRIVKREFYEAGLLASAEFDDDGDGIFERRVTYDEHAEPRK